METTTKRTRRSRKNDYLTRAFEQRNCTSCKISYDAPVKLIGEGVVGKGLCPDCLRASRPAHTAVCPICSKSFQVQAGHSRVTCSGKCKKVHTLLKHAGKVDGSAVTMRAQAAELLEEMARQERDTAERLALEAVTKTTPAATPEEVAQRENEARLTRAFQRGKGTRLDRMANVAATIRQIRAEEATAAAASALPAG